MSLPVHLVQPYLLSVVNVTVRYLPVCLQRLKSSVRFGHLVTNGLLALHFRHLVSSCFLVPIAQSSIKVPSGLELMCHWPVRVLFLNKRLTDSDKENYPSATLSHSPTFQSLPQITLCGPKDTV